tara:strand:+ start:277 stop:792 length:516 start_codon:yes stop_codon:yes gene_type:complete
MASILKVNTIQDATNSNSAMTIDTSGRIAYPAQPRFLCHLASNSTITNTGHDDDWSVSVASWNVRFNVGNMFSNGTITFPTDGVYHIHFQVYANPTNSANYIGCSMNGNAVNETYNANAIWHFQVNGNDTGLTHSPLFNATAGKTLQIGSYVADNSTWRYDGTFLWGYKLG